MADPGGRKVVEPGRRRIKELLGRPTERVPADAGLLANAPNAAITRISSFVPKSPKEMSRIQRRLALAGFHETKHTVVYVVAEVVLTIIGFLVPVFLFGWGAGLIFGSDGRDRRLHPAEHGRSTGR